MDKEKIKKQAEGVWDEVKKVAGITKDGLEKVTKIGQLKIDQTRQKYDRGHLFRELGAAVYEIAKAGKKEFDASVKDLIKKIEEIDQKIEKEAKEISDIKGPAASEEKKEEKKE